MKMTRRRALELCYRLWGWLAETGETDKWAWPEWVGKGGTVSMCDYACPCCAYAWTRDKPCPKCPLLSLWPKGCEYGATPFSQWDSAKTKRTRKKYAAIIRDGAAAELRKYKGWKP